MGFFKEAQRAIIKTNSYINNNNTSLIDLLLLLVTPLITIDIFRHYFVSEGFGYYALSFIYLGLYALMPTLWLRSTVESKDIERDYVYYLKSKKTYFSAAIIGSVILSFIYLPNLVEFANTKTHGWIAHNVPYLLQISYLLLTVITVRLSFIIPLYNSGLELSYKDALKATHGKLNVLMTTLIAASFPLLIFTIGYSSIAAPLLIDKVFTEMRPEVITMIILAPVTYLATPLIMVYSVTALAYHYANYAKSFIMRGEDEPQKHKDDVERGAAITA